MNRQGFSVVARCKCASERNMTKCRLGFVFAAILFASSTLPAAAQGTVMNWIVDGEKREALVVAPQSDAAVKRPLVFAFHGHGGNMNGAAQLMHIHLVPEAIVVSSAGLDPPTQPD